ncbi:MAG: hypothetical protein M3N46_09800 [Actinomycetota bacterium]|nr:hypothetical protein [Actinomycetota bacterium]
MIQVCVDGKCIEDVCELVCEPGMPAAEHAVHVTSASGWIRHTDRQQSDAGSISRLATSQGHEVVGVRCAHPIRLEILDREVVYVDRDQIFRLGKDRVGEDLTVSERLCHQTRRAQGRR